MHALIAGSVSKPGAALLLCILLLSTGCGDGARAPDLTIAVAANFLPTAEALVEDFSAQRDTRITLIGGSTGKLYAQIINGAPFDVFLAADEERPQRLAQSGHAVPQSGFTYARGRLALWSPDPGRIDNDGAVILASAAFRRLAIANPALAPYGAAAREVLEHFGAWRAVQKRLVMGENAGQAFALVATGNAELGLVALANVTRPATMSTGSRWDVPTNLHGPIAQRAVLLIRAADNAVARDFMAYLQSVDARGLIEKAGYDVE